MTDPRRSAIARLGALSLHASGKTDTRSARDAFLRRFEREVDPEGLLEPEERARRALYARKAYFTRLALARHRRSA